MKALKNASRYGLPTCETYYVTDGFVWQEVNYLEVKDLLCMDKEVYELCENGFDSLVCLDDEIKKSNTYCIEVGFMDELIAAILMQSINKNLGLK
jgi:hypothetical protein